jgi:hypothetical protein
MTKLAGMDVASIQRDPTWITQRLGSALGVASPKADIRGKFGLKTTKLNIGKLQGQKRGPPGCVMMSSRSPKAKQGGGSVCDVSFYDSMRQLKEGYQNAQPCWSPSFSGSSI